jgi:DNA modification methylase
VWDSEGLESLSANTKKLKDGGTMIMFFDLWKITALKELMEKYKFKQVRMIIWSKTNPQPLNSSVNYLTNCREIALVGIKKSKPTFNSKYDNGIYSFPYKAEEPPILPRKSAFI